MVCKGVDFLVCLVLVCMLAHIPTGTASWLYLKKNVLQAQSTVEASWRVEYKSIVIDAKAGNKFDNVTDITPQEAAGEWVKFVKGLLDKIYSMKTKGKELFDEIEKSEHTVTIYKSNDNGNAPAATFRDPMTSDTEALQLVQHFRPLYFMDSFAMDVFERRKRRENLKNATGGESPEEVAHKFAAILRKAVDSKKFTLKKIARAAGISVENLQQIATGGFSPTSEQYWKLVLKLYPFMESGGGCNAVIRFTDEEKLRANKDSKYKPKKNFEDVPGEIALAHELIHALHIVSGHRIVRSGWEEEAMTVGMPPFDTLTTINENTFRKAAKLPRRTLYKMQGYSQFSSAYTLGFYCHSLGHDEMCTVTQQAMAQLENDDKPMTAGDAKKEVKKYLTGDNLKMQAVPLDEFSMFRALCQSIKLHTVDTTATALASLVGKTDCLSPTGYLAACKTLKGYFDGLGKNYIKSCKEPAVKTAKKGEDKSKGKDTKKTGDDGKGKSVKAEKSESEGKPVKGEKGKDKKKKAPRIATTPLSRASMADILPDTNVYLQKSQINLRLIEFLDGRLYLSRSSEDSCKRANSICLVRGFDGPDSWAAVVKA